ncbi:MAG: hypothetical protein ACI86H_002289, partial [bacterium]
MWVLFSFFCVGGGGERQALLWRRHGATNVLDRAVGFFLAC